MLLRFVKSSSIRFTSQFIPLRSSWYSSDNASPKPFSEIPSPGGALPVLGHYLRTRKEFNKELEKMFKEVDGPIFRLNVFGKNLLFTDDPSALKDMISFEGKYPSRSFEENLQWFHKQRNEETPMAFETGPKWRELRISFGKQLLPANVYGYVPGFNKATDRLIRNIREMRDSDGYIRDMEELIMYWSLEVGAYFSFGVDFDARNDHNSDAHELKKSVQQIVEVMDHFTYSIPYYRIFPTKFLKDANKASDNVQKIGRMYADQHMDRIMKSVDKNEKQFGQSLLEQWLIEGNMSKDEAIGNAASMMSAGLETTANTTAFMMHELSIHKSVQDKLHHQVLSVLGKDGEPDFDTLQKMPYLMNIIKETQRISPVVSGYPRQLSNDAVILGYSVPAGTLAMYNMTTTKKNSDIYNQPDRFNPDRWSNDEISPYASVPFGVGPRSCWGRRFAEIEMKVFLAKLSQCFIMESDYPEGTRVSYEEKTMIRPAEPIIIKFIERN